MWVSRISPTNVTSSYKMLRRESISHWLHLKKILRIVGCEKRMIVIQDWRKVMLLQRHDRSDLRVQNLRGFHCVRHIELMILKYLVTAETIRLQLYTGRDTWGVAAD